MKKYLILAIGILVVTIAIKFRKATLKRCPHAYNIRNARTKPI